MQEIINEDLAKENQESLLKDDGKGDNLLVDTLTNLEESYVNDEKKKKHKDYDDKMRETKKYIVKPSPEQLD